MNQKQILSITLIFLAIIIHLSISTPDLSLSDDNYEQIHNRQYSWRNERRHQSPEVEHHRWFHNSNNHINGEPSAMANLGQFFSTAFSGRFPFESKNKHVFSMLPFPHMPPIPRPPPPPSPPYLNRDPEFTYWHKNHDQNNYNNRKIENNYHNENQNSNGKGWSYSYKSGQSHHHSFDNGVHRNHDHKWDDSIERQKSWNKDFPHQSYSHIFSHRSSVPEVNRLRQSIPSMDDLINDHFVRDNGFIKEHRFQLEYRREQAF